MHQGLLLASALLLTGTAPAARPQGPLELARHRLQHAPRSQLFHKMPLAKGLFSASFLGAVGGVAFEGVASPKNKDAAHEPIELRYDDTATDGDRLVVNIDGKRVSAALPDWQLVPIARFADSEWTSCVTLFGADGDGVSTRERLENYVESLASTTLGLPLLQQLDVPLQERWLANYHESFDNTLLGLRLLQADFLLSDMVSPDARVALPTTRFGTTKVPILGPGEEAVSDPEPRKKALPEPHGGTAWVLCDYKRSVTFDVDASGSLILEGDPLFWLWAEGPRTPFLRGEPITFEWRSEMFSDTACEALEKANPQVWSACVNTMQYSAFFRYCKGTMDDASWQEFMRDIHAAPVDRIQCPSTIGGPWEASPVGSSSLGQKLGFGAIGLMVALTLVYMHRRRRLRMGF